MLRDARLAFCGLLAVALSVAGGGCGALESDAGTARIATGEATAVGERATATRVRHYRSRPDLRPPAVHVTRRARGTARGYLFSAPKGGAGQNGPMITDDRGELVWFGRPRGDAAMDFRVQEYQGKPVLTWWEGNAVKGWGRGELVIADSSYRTIARVQAKGKHRSDHHDSLITPQGTALIFAYRPVQMSMASVGGPHRGTVMDCAIQEIDIKTGRRLFEWRSLPRVGLRESYKEPPKTSSDPYDYFHINSVQIDTDGNLVISARNTFALYKINRKTGALMWRLGGKRSDFKMGKGTRFAWQHDARFQPDGSLTILDNAAAPQLRDQSRGIALRVNRTRRQVSLKRQYRHPRRLLAPSQANMQALPNGNVFIGWGASPYLSEFSKRGRLLFDMRHLGGSNSYRAYRFPWKGEPTGKPHIAVRGGETRVTIYASWNGATEVAKWKALAGPTPDSLRPIGEQHRTGFETAFRANTKDPYVAVGAIDGSGRTLATSQAVER